MTPRPTGFDQALLSAQPALARYAHRYWPGAAEDLVQETNAKALAAAATFEPGSNMPAWLCVILRNTALGQGRRAWRERELPEAFDRAEGFTMAEPEARLRLQELAGGMAKLGPAAEGVLMDSAEGYAIREIALRRGFAEGTCKSKIGRARAKLREAGLG